MDSNKSHLSKIPAITLLFWIMKICATTFGETGGDLLAQTMKVGYGASSLILVGILITILAFWRYTEGNLSVENIKSFKVEILYWTAILFSNTLGTALGDFLADDSGLGFGGGDLAGFNYLLVGQGISPARSGDSLTIR